MGELESKCCGLVSGPSLSLVQNVVHCDDSWFGSMLTFGPYGSHLDVVMLCISWFVEAAQSQVLILVNEWSEFWLEVPFRGHLMTWWYSHSWTKYTKIWNIDFACVHSWILYISTQNSVGVPSGWSIYEVITDLW